MPNGRRFQRERYENAQIPKLSPIWKFVESLAMKEWRILNSNIRLDVAMNVWRGKNVWKEKKKKDLKNVSWNKKKKIKNITLNLKYNSNIIGSNKGPNLGI